MAIPVRTLWEATSDEDRARAHTRCVAILEMWLGKRTRLEVAKQLELPPLRLWQLSQQALSGMLVALVHQPRVRARAGITLPTSEASELKALRAEHARLRATLKVSEELNEVLRCLPGHKRRRERDEPAVSASRIAKKKGSKGASAPGHARRT